MEIRLNLPADDVAFLDAYAAEQGLESRSAAVHRAVRALRSAELGSRSEAAWAEWSAQGEADAWNLADGDGARS